MKKKASSPPRGTASVRLDGSVCSQSAVPEIDVKSMLVGQPGNLLQLAWLGVLANMAGLALPLFSLAIYDRVLPLAAERTLWLLVLGITLVLVLDVLVRMWRTWALAAWLKGLAQQQDDAVLESMTRQRGSGALARQLESWRLLHEAREQLVMHVLPHIADGAFVVLFLLALAWVAPVLLPVPLVLLALALAVQLLMLPLLGRVAQQAAQGAQGRTLLALDILRSAALMRLWNRLPHSLARWHSAAPQLHEADARGQVVQGLGQHLTLLLSQAGFVAVMVVGVEQVLAGHLTIGALVASSILSMRILAPGLHVVDTLGRIRRVQENLKLVQQNLRTPQEASHPGAECPAMLPPELFPLELTDVGMTYSGAPKPALRGVRVRFQRGECWALAGGIGSGKSTLLQLLAAHLVPTEGVVQLGGVAQVRFATSVWRSAVMLVPQEPAFPDLSLSEIISGTPQPEPEKLAQALHISGLERVLHSMGVGTEYRPGPEAAGLSGGQRQLLGWAALVYRNPAIWLLDEATSQLDADTEAALLARLKPFLKQHQPLLIAATHRSALLELCDNLLVLEQGQVVAGGDRRRITEKLKAAATRAERNA